MPRLFIAIDLPDDIKRDVTGLCQGLPGVRWLDPNHLHLTIKFIGEADTEACTAIRYTLTGEGLAGFACQLKGVGCFPAKGRPKVIWAGVQAEAGLARLQAKVESDLHRLGIPPEQRQFSPHITLARLKALQLQQAEVVKYLATHNLFQSRSFPVKDFRLYSSLLTAKGAIHTLEQAYLLP